MELFDYIFLNLLLKTIFKVINKKKFVKTILKNFDL